jgi:dipeptidyl-peptidase-4
MRLTNLLSFSALLVLTIAIEPLRKPRQPIGNGTRRLTYNETTPTPINRPTSQSVSWISGEQDGSFARVAKILESYRLPYLI